MNDIINRWSIHLNTTEDLIQIMLEYDSVFNDGKLTYMDCLKFLTMFQFPYMQFIDTAIRMLLDKKNIEYTELKDRNGNIIKRYLSKNYE